MVLISMALAQDPLEPAFIGALHTSVLGEWQARAALRRASPACLVRRISLYFQTGIGFNPAVEEQSEALTPPRSQQSKR
jgi:hypothetical protein